MPALRVPAGTGQRHLAREGFERERRRGRRVQPSRVQRPEGFPVVASGGSAEGGAHRRGEQAERPAGECVRRWGGCATAALHRAPFSPSRGAAQCVWCALHGQPALADDRVRDPDARTQQLVEPVRAESSARRLGEPSKVLRPPTKQTPRTPRCNAPRAATRGAHASAESIGASPARG
jgi:hypothetical protein